MKQLNIILLATILTITASNSFSQQIKVNGSLKDECKLITNVIERFVDQFMTNNMNGSSRSSLAELGMMKAAIETHKIMCR